MCVWAADTALSLSIEKQQETDEEMARRLQRDYDIQGSYTAHDATLAQQLQGEDGPAVPVSPLQNELSEHYARQLQEEEDQNVMRVSGEQFDVRQRRLMEQRRLRQTNEQSGEYGQRTEEELDEVREQIREHRRRKQDEELRREEDDQRRRDERMQSNEELAQAAHDQPSYRLDPREDDNEQLRHQHAASGSYYQGTGSRSASDDEMDVEESAGGRVHHNEREHVNKNYDEISDIPCDLCGAAIPFEDYSRHLVSVTIYSINVGVSPRCHRQRSIEEMWTILIMHQSITTRSTYQVTTSTRDGLPLRHHHLLLLLVL